MSHIFYSLKTGKNKNLKGVSLHKFKEIFLRVYENFERKGYFDEYLGWFCRREGKVEGKLQDIELVIWKQIRKDDLWPIRGNIDSYSEDDVLDILEFLYLNVSKPIDEFDCGEFNCGMHWKTFDKNQGQKIFRQEVNEILSLYITPFELSANGEILHKPDKGFEGIFEAKVPSSDIKITSRVDSAVIEYRRHGATLDDRRKAVNELAGVLEYLKPKMEGILTSKDESDLFNLANNFGIRHHNERQKTDYDASIWLSWMFYHYLSTIHVILRKIEKESVT